MSVKLAPLSGITQLGMALKLSTNVKREKRASVKKLKLKFRKFWRLILTFVDIRQEKLVGDPPNPHPPPLILKLNAYTQKKGPRRTI